jgi:hypothetical protein
MPEPSAKAHHNAAAPNGASTIHHDQAATGPKSASLATISSTPTMMKNMTISFAATMHRGQRPCLESRCVKL